MSQNAKKKSPVEVDFLIFLPSRNCTFWSTLLKEFPCNAHFVPILCPFVDPIPCRRYSQKKITVIGAGTLTQVSAAVRPARGDPLKQTSTAKPHPKTCDHPHVSTCGGRGHMKLKKKRCSTTGKAAVDEDGVPCVMGYLPVTEPPSMETLALTPTQPNSP